MNCTKNIQIQGKHGKPILTDVYYKKNNTPKNIVIFCHGYKGYKDWGAWNLVATSMANENLFFLKMNFSHNGGTAEQPIDFPDLEAFGQNNFMKELDDLDSVISWIDNSTEYDNEINTKSITLIGHSRGGGIVLLKAASDHRITKVITWAGVSDFGSRFPVGEQLEQWKKNGVAYITNARTNQQMPHYYQFYTSFKEFESELNIKTAVEKLSIPYFIVHGSADETVSLAEAELLNSWTKQASLYVLPDANHTFGSTQPWDSNSLPEDLDAAYHKTLVFLKS
ncbi:alpha/beta hydrolase family protein [Lutimonas sp.]|uniref:alpha/beta hydrolase family protein n=1 Tax=Lutimonas sp. TaxID=1872403 RepID=UPI003D9BE5D0